MCAFGCWFLYLVICILTILDLALIIYFIFLEGNFFFFPSEKRGKRIGGRSLLCSQNLSSPACCAKLMAIIPPEDNVPFFF